MLDVFVMKKTMNEVCAETKFLRTKWEAVVITPAGARCQKTDQGYELYAMFGNEEWKQTGIYESLWNMP